MSNFPKTTYGDYGLPFYGAIYNRNLTFKNADFTKLKRPTISLKNVINPRLCENYIQNPKPKNNFGRQSTKQSTKPTRPSTKPTRPSTNNKDKYLKNKYGEIWYPQKFIDLNYNPSTGGYINSNSPLGPYFALGLGNYPRSMYKQVYFGNKYNKYSFGKDKRSRSPEKYEPSYHSVFENEDPDLEEEQIQNILIDPDTQHGDYIVYQSNNQMRTKNARIFRDRQGNLHKGQWRYLYEDYFGRVPQKIKYCLPKQKKFPVNTKKKCSAALSYARYAPNPCDIARCVKKNCKKYPTVGTHSKLMKKCNL